MLVGVAFALRFQTRLAGDEPTVIDENITTAASASNENDPLQWWLSSVSQPILDEPTWVTFDLSTIMLDTLRSSPLIQSVSASTSIALERAIQQDAAFDPALLFKTRAGRTNDPVGNTLTTGGPPRLNEASLTGSAGIRQTNRSGTVVDLSQNVGLTDSNSQFFVPGNQANARLSLSLSQPLYAGRGKLYNERLLTQARIDSRVSWQEMRQSVEERIAEVMITYWRLFESRCNLAQQQALLERGRAIERIVLGRQGFDSGPVEIAKVRQRIARRTDRQIELVSEVLLGQARLTALTGSTVLSGVVDESQPAARLELIPRWLIEPPDITYDLRDAVLNGIENRPEIRSATAELEAAAVGVSVTRNQLLPQLDAVVEAYLAGLRGDNRLGNAFIDQFADSVPGIAAGLQYDLPSGRRYVQSRHREAHLRYRQKTEELRETIIQTRQAIESALIGVERAAQQRHSKRILLETTLAEETIITRRWEMMAGDSSGAGLVLDTVLDAQQRRADAEREWVSAHTEYRIALVALERAMGTLLVEEGIQPEQAACSSDVHFISVDSPDGLIETEIMTP